MQHLARDIRYAVRGLGRSPLFTAVALVSIALGIGANTAIFTLVDEVLVRMLPVKNPDELVLFLHPAVITSGKRLFEAVRKDLALRTLEVRPFDAGATLLRYALEPSSSA